MNRRWAMNEKQLAQIDAWLEGQHRYKLLDCEQTALLQLKGSRLQVWLCVYLYENDDQQSWLSNGSIQRLTGLTENTVRAALQWLQANGWLKNTGHVAAIKYLNPTQGAYHVPIIRVDNPLKNCTPAKTEVDSSKPPQKLHPQKLRVPPSKIEDKVSVSGSGSGSSSASKASKPSPTSGWNESESRLSPSPPSTDVGVPPVEMLKAKDTTKTKPRTLASVSRWLSKYDQDKPEDFNEWSISAQAIWVESHRLRATGQTPVQPTGQVPVPSEKVPVPAEDEFDQLLDEPRPVPGKFKCPSCDFTHQYGSSVAGHIERSHPELGKQSFRLPCPTDGCNWGTWWNKVTANKAEKDAELLEHLD